MTLGKALGTEPSDNWDDRNTNTHTDRPTNPQGSHSATPLIGETQGSTVPSWATNPVFLVVAMIVTFGSSWAGTQTSLVKHQIEQAELRQLHQSFDQFNQMAQPQRWSNLRNGRWQSFGDGITEAALAAQTGVIEFESLSRNPLSAIPVLKRLDTRWLQIDIGNQQLTAWDGDRAVRTISVSTGKSGTPTRPGVWTIYTKIRSARMRGPGYDVPDVPYTMYYDGGFGIHGAYWHNNFGQPMSHGCTNLSVDQARWFFSWASVGTPVVVHS